MKISVCLGLCLSLPAFAGTLTCHLTDPQTGKAIEASIDATDPNAVAYTADEIGDLSFNLDSPACDLRGECEANVTFNSSTVQDEVGSMTIAFSNRNDQDLVVKEPITDEDQNLVFTCAFKK